MFSAKLLKVAMISDSNLISERTYPMSTTTPHASSLPAVLSPVITPFTADGSPDVDRLGRQCRWLLENGVGLAVFGTNSEANSLSARQKRAALEGLVSAGLPANQMMPGTGACSVDDAVEMTRAAVDLGAGGVLMLPPFYYKDVSDDGLFAYYSDVIQQVGDSRLQVYIYNIPQVTKIPLSVDLLERLVKAYPKTVVGMKDSSGDWAYTESCINRLKSTGFRAYAGSESFLLKTLRAGGVGCISATANVNPAAISRLAAEWQNADADERQSDLDAVRSVFQKFPMIAAMKHAVSVTLGDTAWRAVRPPLVSLGSLQQAELMQALNAIGFEMKGLAA
jgi:4-hydroxy-tetrahydrodipicolinate synthase